MIRCDQRETRIDEIARGHRPLAIGYRLDDAAINSRDTRDLRVGDYRAEDGGWSPLLSTKISSWCRR